MRPTSRIVRGAAAVLSAAVVLAACGGGSSPDDAADGDAAEGAGGAGSEAAIEDEAEALLGVLDPGVDVADEPVDPDDAQFRPGEDGEGLVVGDVVRTDPSGFAEVQWFEGALARVDVDTVYALTTLDATPRSAVVVTDLQVGRIWNRLRADEVEAYEVTTDVATAAVRGTAFWVACDGACTFAVLEGTVLVTADDGTEVTLEAGQQVTVDAEGVPAAVTSADPDDAWVVRNAALDEDAGFDALEPPEAVVAGGCPLVDVPDGWVEEADPEAAGPAAAWCRYVRPDAGGNEFATIEWFAEDSADVRSRSEEIRPFYEEERAGVAASGCSDGMRDEFVEISEPLGDGELFAYWWRVVRGPFDAAAGTCPDGLGSSFNSVVIGGQVFVLRPTEGVPIGCTVVGVDQTPEEWNEHIACLFDKAAERDARYRELAAVLLGA